MNPAIAWQLIWVFGSASLLSFGGGNSIVPELQAQTVARHWVTAQQFADNFAIAQVAPGPSSLLVTLLGYRAAGIAGALLATAAMTIPASALVYCIARLWRRNEGARWRDAFEHGLAPVAVALAATSGIVVASSVDRSGVQLGLSLAAALLLGATKLNPSVVVLGGGVLGALANGL
jgi:chromate transporter